MQEIPPALQQQIIQFQQIQKNLEALIKQRMQLEMQLRELENAEKELEKVKAGESVYKNVGNLIIKTEKEKALSEIKEKKETYDIAIKRLKSQEETYQQKLKELEKSIQAALSNIGVQKESGAG